VASGKFIAYYRVSTDKQGVSGLGLEAQEAAVHKFLNGGEWDLSEVQEIETGTRKRRRPVLEQALLRCQREKATLIIAKLDRLARNVAFVSALMESGVEFVCCDMPSANRFTIHVLAAAAENEAEQISARTKAALQAAKARGKKLGNPEHLTDEARAKGHAANRQLAQEAYALIAHRIRDLKAQDKSLATIASQLNSEGYMTRMGAQFTACTVQRILERVGG
jgi:DNA invertase Pin-like site-specific DNA recombinase